MGNGRASQGLMKQVAAEIKADAMVVSESNRNEGEENAWFPDQTGRAAVASTNGTLVEDIGIP